jgi:predicted Zn-dependent protease
VTVVLRSLRKDPLSGNLLLAQGVATLEAGSPGLALPIAKAAVEQDPLQPECWVLLARCYLALKRPLQARGRRGALPAGA